MNTKVNITYNEVKYTLEYNRMAVKYIESEGFELEKFSKQPMNMIELVFAGAFYKNHRNISQTLLDEIYKSCKDKDKLIGVITKMITECYTSLMENPDEDNEGNATWEVVDLAPKTNQK